jgi:hypothetical protein
MVLATSWVCKHVLTGDFGRLYTYYSEHPNIVGCAVYRCGVEQRQLAWLITTRSQVRVLPPLHGRNPRYTGGSERGRVG